MAVVWLLRYLHHTCTCILRIKLHPLFWISVCRHVGGAISRITVTSILTACTYLNITSYPSSKIQKRPTSRLITYIYPVTRVSDRDIACYVPESWIESKGSFDTGKYTVNVTVHCQKSSVPFSNMRMIGHPTLLSQVGFRPVPNETV
jgi:hypothetical protein